jgi:hypothetical protein
MKIKVPADIPEPDSHENGAGEGAVPGSEEDSKGQVEAIRIQKAPSSLPLG